MKNQRKFSLESRPRLFPWWKRLRMKWVWYLQTQDNARGVPLIKINWTSSIWLSEKESVSMNYPLRNSKGLKHQRNRVNQSDSQWQFLQDKHGVWPREKEVLQPSQRNKLKRKRRPRREYRLVWIEKRLGVLLIWDMRLLRRRGRKS